MEDGGVLELYDVSRVDEDLPEVTSPFDCDWESFEVLVRKLVLDRRRRSLKKGIVDDTDAGPQVSTAMQLESQSQRLLSGRDERQAPRRGLISSRGRRPFAVAVGRQLKVRRYAWRARHAAARQEKTRGRTEHGKEKGKGREDGRWRELRGEARESSRWVGSEDGERTVTTKAGVDVVFVADRARDGGPT
ncbi:hypothetical protein VTN00DRAFT_1774 [Thermoascus crustaceus]|uniref:uncharacterized protein n=1 Tax=Thermoascus crustaceus TaxID=5088 RepID=UPI0037434D43